MLMGTCFSLTAQTPNNDISKNKDFGITLNYLYLFDGKNGFEVGMESSIAKNVITSYHFSGAISLIQIYFYFQTILVKHIIPR